MFKGHRAPSNHLDQLKWSVQAAAKDLAPSVTLRGRAEPHELPIKPKEYTRMLETRLRVEQAITRQYRQQGDDLGNWSFANGRYLGGSFAWNKDLTYSNHPLTSLESLIAKSIDHSLEKSDNKPVVALDFGGGRGLSWMRIASQPTYKEAIDRGQLVMAVTNLGSVPDQTPDRSGYTGIARSLSTTNRIDRLYGETSFQTEDLQWAQESQHHVQYLDANALELSDMTVALPDGTPLPLMGNVGVIHESYALVHTHAPDLALANFGTLLSPGGTLYSQAAMYYHFMHSEQSTQVTLDDGEVVAMDDSYSHQRQVALVVGSTMLQQQPDFSYAVDDDRGIFRRIAE